MKVIDYFLVSLIIFLGLLFRFYKIDIPLADFHSWRQTDTAAVAKIFLQEDFNLLKPRYFDLSSIQSGKENPQGWRMVEFPVYNAIFAFLHKNLSFISLEIWGRLTSIFFSLVIIFLVYYFLLKEKNRWAAVFGALVYAIMPFFVFYSRVILPETTALGFSVLAIFFLYLFNQRRAKGIFLNIILYCLSAIFFSLGLLAKPTTIFFIFPLLYLFFKREGLTFLRKLSFYFYVLLSLTPFFLWRLHIRNFPEGIPASDWLIASAHTPAGLESIFFRPAFFRWIFLERINNLILGGYLSFFLILGIISRAKKKFLHSFLVASLGYLFTFQGGNVQHDYYQTLILPTLAIFCGLGVAFILENRKVFSPFLAGLMIFFIICASWAFSFFEVRNHYHYSVSLIQQANLIKTLTAPESKIVVDRFGDTTLLYLSERKGAPAIYKDPETLKKLGYQFLATSNRQTIEELKKKYPVIFENENFSLFKLQ
ncbi:MAG: glycosyltransferase family 39 protein [Patescibacteria group bacterium]|nr:glycosyltransferase family 39 protein [Patescibacteria group bacterium]